MADFYCKTKANCGNLSIKEWNERFKEAIRLEIPESEMDVFLEERPCEKQCVECACIVGDRRIKTKKLIKG